MQIARLQFLGLDADQGDDAAHDGDFFRGLGVLVQDGQGHGFALGAADLGHRVLQGNVQGRLPVDFDDDVSGLEPGLVRRRVLDGRDDGQAFVADADLNADAAEFALEFFLHHLELVEFDEGRMRVDGIEHALDGAVDEIRAVHFLNIVLFDQIKNLTELLEGLVVVRVPRLAG